MITTLRTIALICVTGALCLTSACSKKSDNTPGGITACITAMPDSATTGVSKAFSSCTIGALVYIWSFGDGTTAAISAPTHTYTTAGVYNASLTVTNMSGQSSTSNFTITVKDPTAAANPYGSWTFQNATYLPDTCNTSASSGSITWTTNPNSPTVRAVQVLFYNNTLPTGPGIYTVTEGSPQAANQVAVLEAILVGGNATGYISTGGNGRQTVAVTITNGKISATGNNITMLNTSTGTDSTSITFGLNQR